MLQLNFKHILNYETRTLQLHNYTSFSGKKLNLSTEQLQNRNFRQVYFNECLKTKPFYSENRNILKSRNFLTHNVNKSKGNTNNKYLSSNCSSKLYNKNRSLNNASQMVSTFGFIHSRNFSTNPVAAETLGTLSKYLQGTPVTLFQDVLLWIHSSTGLPWWATIIINALALRVIFIIPMTLYQHNLIARVENIKEEIDGFVWKLKKEAQFKTQTGEWTNALAKQRTNLAMSEQMQKLYIRDNCHPAKIIALSLIHYGVLVSQTFAISNLCYMLPNQNINAEITQIELSCGGFGWISNLLENDSYLIIPLYLGILNYSIMEVRDLLIKKNESSMFMQALRKGIKVAFPIIFIVISANLPTAIILSWATGSTSAFLENLALHSPKIRRLIGIPKTMSEHNHPYSVLYEKIKIKYKLPTKIKAIK